ncbi:MAG: UPF0182 family protein [Longimonas sp.]|uniref:UPF0182 family membrane protein n=1 Tax=Longimonas sp. TaxID=2039626 RepID=UPI003358C0BF
MSLIRSNRWVQGLLLTIGAFLTLLLIAPGIFVEYFWLSELGYGSVFWTKLGFQATMFGLVLLIAGSYFGGNILLFMKRLPPYWASQLSQGDEGPQLGGRPLTEGRLKRLGLGLAAIFTLLFAIGFSGRWDELMRYWHAQPYGRPDPVFSHDLGFYMLELPFIQSLQSGFVGLVFLGLLILVTGYVLVGAIGVRNGQLELRPSAIQHIGVNAILLLIGWAWGFYLDRYELLMERSGTVFGANYTDINVVIPALWVMIFATLFLAVLVALNLKRFRFRLVSYGAGLYVLVLIASMVVAPRVVDQVRVIPNELQVEEPYIANNIEFTREAFGINDSVEREYPARTELDPEALRDNEDVVRNVRLWDPRLLVDTYVQLQQIRLYYQFYEVDVDRYVIDGEYRQVMLSPRELTQRLPSGSDTWFNRHLQYTHGFGTVMNLVAREGIEGSPEFLMRDLPPQVVDSSLVVDNPAIYYGSRTNNYRIAPSDAQELHYPAGDENVYTNYTGHGGILLDSFWKQLLLAYYMGDYNIVLSQYLNEESRIQIWNNVSERVQRVAPFLMFDRDPYFVISNKRQYWIQDAYTTSRSFPYSESIEGHGKYNGLQYIRNSVKIVVDAYDGDVGLYVMEPDDPIVQTYVSAFPDLFQEFDQMGAGLQRHIRYPQDMFELQIERLRRYHMQRPQVFYNNEDLWTRPIENYDGRQVRMEPYYIMTRLPGEEELQFMLMTPLTPDDRDNMIAWIAARSDPQDYGEIVTYKLPKDRLIYGPNQIESRIDQDPEISQQIALWDQRGSRVLRGNLIVVPIEDSFLYVEPIFLIADNIRIPQLQRVIVSYDEFVVMERTLNQGLNRIFGEEVIEAEESIVAQVQDTPDQPISIEDAPGVTPQNIGQARTLIRQARQALQDGDFGQFGRRFDELEELLQEEADEVPTVPTGAPDAPDEATPPSPVPDAPPTDDDAAPQQP